MGAIVKFRDEGSARFGTVILSHFEQTKGVLS